jgi:hypothetical protein
VASGRVEGLGGGFEEAVKLLVEASRKLREALALLRGREVAQLIAFYNQYRGCSLEYTWARNPKGKRYWYWYLKCPDAPVKSHYLGRDPEPFKATLEAARTVAEAFNRLPALESLAGELEQAAQKLSLGVMKAPKAPGGGQ